jgi:arylformamidase
VGTDYLSVERFGSEPDVHRILLEAGVVIVEGLDLSGVEPGPWDLLCLPVRLIGTEAAPARVVLRRGRSR